MNKVVTREMLASELPEAIRGDIAPDHRVRVTVAEMNEAPTSDDRRARILGYIGAAKGEPVSIDEAVDRVRQLRDDWE